MAYTLTFSTVHDYDAGEPGITIPIRLVAGQIVVDVQAKLDSGASYCIFQRQYAETLGLQLETGVPQWRFASSRKGQLEQA